MKKMKNRPLRSVATKRTMTENSTVLLAPLVLKSLGQLTDYYASNLIFFFCIYRYDTEPV